jgi:cell division protein FtsZ
VKNILTSGETATILYGEEESEDPEAVVMDTLKNPLLDIDYTGAKGVLIHVTCDESVNVETINRVVEGITKQLDPGANVIFGIRIDPELEGRIKVITIMNGVHSPGFSERRGINKQYVPLHQEIAEIRVVS